jgi:hypothetical protein
MSSECVIDTRIYQRDEVEQLLIRNQRHFLAILHRGILGENLELYDWQLDCLKI